MLQQSCFIDNRFTLNKVDQQDVINITTAIRTAEMMTKKSLSQHHVVRIKKGLVIYDDYEVSMRRHEIDEIVYTTGHGYIFNQLS